MSGSHDYDMLERLKSMDQNMFQIKAMLAEVINYMREAEKEVSEKMRRFTMYMHDIHDITYLYEQRGHQIPEHIREELERCDDRFRQLLKEAHSDGGTFEKVRREMSADVRNRWNHTRQLSHHRKDQQ